MKLMICIVNQKYGIKTVQALNEKGYRVTKLASTGGFLKQGNDTFLIGVTDEVIPQLKQDLQEIVLEIEKEKNWNASQYRYTFFIVKGQNFLPILNN